MCALHVGCSSVGLERGIVERDGASLRPRPLNWYAMTGPLDNTHVGPSTGFDMHVGIIA